MQPYTWKSEPREELQQTSKQPVCKVQMHRYASAKKLNSIDEIISLRGCLALAYLLRLLSLTLIFFVCFLHIRADAAAPLYVGDCACIGFLFCFRFWIKIACKLSLCPPAVSLFRRPSFAVHTKSHIQSTVIHTENWSQGPLLRCDIIGWLYRMPCYSLTVYRVTSKSLVSHV